VCQELLLAHRGIQCSVDYETLLTR